MGYFLITNLRSGVKLFVTRKITRGLARIKLGLQDCSISGQFRFKKRLGTCKDYVEMQWLMLQQDKAEDFVIATGVQYSVRDFINIAANFLDLNYHWEGSGVTEKARDKDGRVIIAVDEKYFRPTEVETLLGDAIKQRKNLAGLLQDLRATGQ